MSKRSVRKIRHREDTSQAPSFKERVKQGQDIANKKRETKVADELTQIAQENGEYNAPGQ